MAYFPMYIDLEGKKVIVVGGGKVALRKINSLLYFGAKIAVIAPKVCDDIKAIKGINVHESNVALDILQNADIVELCNTVKDIAIKRSIKIKSCIYQKKHYKHKTKTNIKKHHLQSKIN